MNFAHSLALNIPYNSATRKPSQSHSSVHNGNIIHKVRTYAPFIYQTGNEVPENEFVHHRVFSAMMQWNYFFKNSFWDV